VTSTERKKKLERLGAKIDPDLRDFIDRVIVPVLVREYIAEHQTGIHIAEPLTGVPQCETSKGLSAERIQ